jgi:NAD(P)-dependent dehydrogenase (short-subunit alcohol dehydrogenase family)
MGMLDGKVVAVTGAGNGLGRAYAMALGAAGAQVICSDVDADAARLVAADVVAAGGEAIGRADDVGRWSSGEGLVAGAVEAYGRLDSVVNNAGVLRDRMMWNLTEQDLDDVYNVHLKGSFATSIALVKHLRARGDGGAIVNVTSAAHQGHPGQANYSAMKGAIASMTYTMAMEAARFGIRVNAISPMAWTGMTMTVAKDEETAKRMAERIGPPERVAPVIVYLLSDDAAWISGQIIGASNERVSLLLHPKESRHSYCVGGWTAEELAKRFRGGTGAVLEPCGSTTVQYPWYEGIRPQTEPAQAR